VTHDPANKSVRYASTVSVRLTWELAVPVKESKDCIISYRFTTTPGDIGFGLFYRETNGTESTLKELDRVPSHIGAANGTIHPACPGVLYFRWDNSYSWLTAKELTYVVEVTTQDPSAAAPTPDIMLRTPLKRPTPTSGPQDAALQQLAEQKEARRKEELEALQKQVASLQTEASLDKSELARAKGELARALEDKERLQKELSSAREEAQAKAEANCRARFENELLTLRATNGALLTKCDLLSQEVASFMMGQQHGLALPPHALRSPSPDHAAPKNVRLEHHFNVSIVNPSEPVSAQALTPTPPPPPLQQLEARGEASYQPPSPSPSSSRPVLADPQSSSSSSSSLSSSSSSSSDSEDVQAQGPGENVKMHPLLVPVNAMLYGLTLGSVNAWGGGAPAAGGVQGSETDEDKAAEDMRARELEVLRVEKPPRPEGLQRSPHPAPVQPPLKSILKKTPLSVSSLDSPGAPKLAARSSIGNDSTQTTPLVSPQSGLLGGVYPAAGL